MKRMMNEVVNGTACVCVFYDVLHCHFKMLI